MSREPGTVDSFCCCCCSSPAVVLIASLVWLAERLDVVDIVWTATELVLLALPWRLAFEDWSPLMTWSVPVLIEGLCPSAEGENEKLQPQTPVRMMMQRESSGAMQDLVVELKLFRCG